MDRDNFDNRIKFHLEINSFDEFVKFVALIRDEDLDSDKIKKLTASLNKSTSELNKAIKSQGEK